MSTSNHAAYALPLPDRQVFAAQARAQRRQRQRLQMLGLALGSYGIDTALLMLLAAIGVIAQAVPWAYAAAALAACTVFLVLLHGDWADRQTDHYLVVPQMFVNAAISIGFVLWVPQIGALLLMLLFVNFAFGALRMNLRPVLAGAVLISVLVGAVIASVGDRIAMPMGDSTERAISGLWFALVLARSAMLGTYASELRALLAKRSAELADTFDRLEQLASRDELTGALNRRSVLRLLEEERERMQRSGQPFGVALLDIDHFKQVNELFGHIVGDDVLRRFALRVAAEMRGTDRLGRYGGEEFLLLLTGVADIDAAAAVATRVRLAVADAKWNEVQRGLDVTVSVGVALCRPNESVEQLLARADVALHQAKHDGRNCVRIA